MYTLQRPRQWTQDETVLLLEQTTQGDFEGNQQTHYIMRTDRKSKGEAFEAKTVRRSDARTKVIWRSFLDM